jgi:hypothetical protein
MSGLSGKVFQSRYVARGGAFVHCGFAGGHGFLCVVDGLYTGLAPFRATVGKAGLAGVEMDQVKRPARPLFVPSKQGRPGQLGSPPVPLRCIKTSVAAGCDVAFHQPFLE